MPAIYTVPQMRSTVPNVPDIQKIPTPLPCFPQVVPGESPVSVRSVPVQAEGWSMGAPPWERKWAAEGWEPGAQGLWEPGGASPLP